MIGKRKNGGRRLLESTIEFLWGKLEVAGYKLAMDDMISLYSGTGLTFYKNLPMYFTSAFLPGKSHGQRSLVGCGAWVCKESDMTEGLNGSNGEICLLLRVKRPDFLIEIDQM